MSYPEPDLNNPLVSALGKALDGLRLWILAVTRRQMFRGESSPEGVLEAVEDATYVDTDRNELYYKKNIDLLGDESKGWVPFTSSLVIEEADGTYQVGIFDDIINCVGTFTVTFPPSDVAFKEITVSSTNGTITVAADVTIEASVTLTTGTSQTWYLARGQWWRK